MTQREHAGAEVKQIPLRLDRELYEELSRRSTIEKKSMSDIVRDALRSHFDAVRVTKPQLRAAIERIAREDAEILEALGRGPEETEKWTSPPATSTSTTSSKSSKR